MADVLSSCPPAALQGLGATRAEEQDKAALIARAVQQPDVKGLTPLHMACIRGHAQAADVLMQLGSNPFAMDSVGRTPLHYAASWGFADCINAVLG
jgi:ankyrin repeat protein